MAPKTALHFVCPQSGLGVTLEPGVVRRLSEVAARALPNETGGVLVGRYLANRTIAQVEDLSTATGDSKASPRSFVRGTRRLANWLQCCLNLRGQTYLGEWHTHPGELPHPSRRDVDSIREIAASPAMERPETILVILGGDLRSKPSFHVSVITAHVHLRLEERSNSPATGAEGDSK